MFSHYLEINLKEPFQENSPKGEEFPLILDDLWSASLIPLTLGLQWSLLCGERMYREGT